MKDPRKDNAYEQAPFSEVVAQTDGVHVLKRYPRTEELSHKKCECSDHLL